MTVLAFAKAVVQDRTTILHAVRSVGILAE
jgi:hypothetical protein